MTGTLKWIEIDEWEGEGHEIYHNATPHTLTTNIRHAALPVKIVKSINRDSIPQDRKERDQHHGTDLLKQLNHDSGVQQANQISKESIGITMPHPVV